MRPTVMLVFNLEHGQEAAAFDERGEIVTAPVEDGEPQWDDGTVADSRGAGGQDGFDRLHDALKNAEENAASVGLDVSHVPAPA